MFSRPYLQLVLRHIEGVCHLFLVRSWTLVDSLQHIKQTFITNAMQCNKFCYHKHTDAYYTRDDRKILSFFINAVHILPTDQQYSFYYFASTFNCDILRPKTIVADQLATHNGTVIKYESTLPTSLAAEIKMCVLYWYSIQRFNKFCWINLWVTYLFIYRGWLDSIQKTNSWMEDLGLIMFINIFMCKTCWNIIIRNIM